MPREPSTQVSKSKEIKASMNQNVAKGSAKSQPAISFLRHSGVGKILHQRKRNPSRNGITAPKLAIGVRRPHQISPFWNSASGQYAHFPSHIVFRKGSCQTKNANKNQGTPSTTERALGRERDPSETGYDSFSSLLSLCHGLPIYVGDEDSVGSENASRLGSTAKSFLSVSYTHQTLPTKA